MSEGETKKLSFRLPLELYESFFRAFPGWGERTRFLRQACAVGVELKEDEKPLSSRLKGSLKNEY